MGLSATGAPCSSEDHHRCLADGLVCLLSKFKTVAEQGTIFHTL